MESDSIEAVAAAAMMETSAVANKLTKEEEEYLDRLLAEKKVLDLTAGLDFTQKLMNAEIERVLSGAKDGSSRDDLSSSAGKKFCDVTKDKPIKVTVRTSVPTRDHPKFNFVGKLLGPKGNSLKRLQEETLTKMAILGRGSMRDKHKEEEYRHSLEPRYKHLNDELHVEITAYAAPAEAHARIALALTEIRRFLVPDYNDDIRQEQLREMQLMNSGMPPGQHEAADSGNGGNVANVGCNIGNIVGNNNRISTSVAVSSSAPAPAPPPVMTLTNPLHLPAGLGASPSVLPNGMNGPLRAVPYPPVLPLMHPALRGLCKPSHQSLAIGLTAGAPSLLSRYRPGLMATSCPNGTTLVNLNRRPMVGRHLKDDYADAGTDAGLIELYHRYNLPYEGSDGVASPDDRDEATEDLLASANVGADFPLLESNALKLSTLERSRYRHEPYARYSTNVIT